MHIVTGACVDVRDARCIEECPVDCIHYDPDDRMVYISPATCIDCRACAIICPTGAIVSWEDLPTSLEPWREINRVWFEDKAAARAEVDRRIRRRT